MPLCQTVHVVEEKPMSLPLIFACFWVLAATVTAMLPMRRQYVPGVALLIAAPLLLIWIGKVHGALVALACLAAVVSVMRNPLRYLWARMRGRNPEVPK
jgi:amino acid transporter